MKMAYRFDKDYSVTDILFRGLDGREQVTSTKEALQLMRIRNPSVDFIADVKKGVYNNLSDEDYQKALDTIQCLQGLWRAPGEPADAKTEYEMNPLVLLSNAIQVITSQHVQLEKYRNAEKK